MKKKCPQSISPSVIHHNFTFTVLTPVAVTDGQESTLTPYGEFFVDQDEVCYLDQERLALELSRQKGLTESFIRKVRTELQNKDLGFNLREFLDDAGMDLEYLVRLRLPAEDVTEDLKQHIRQVIRTHGRPFLPGSTLKGSLRTLIWHDWLTRDMHGKRALKGFVSKIKAQRSDEQDLKRAFKDLERQLFGMLERNRRRLGEVSKPFRGHDLNGHVSRLWGLTDSSTLPETALGVYQSNRYNLRRNTPEIPGPLEAIQPQHKLNFTMRVDPILGEAAPELAWMLDGKAVLEKFRNLAQAFATWEMDRLLNTDGLEDMLEFYIEMQDGLQKRKQTYMRLGFGKSYMLNSVGLALHEEDEEVVNVLKNKFRLQGDKTSTVFPVTRLVSMKDKIPFDPFGWGKLELTG